MGCRFNRSFTHAPTHTHSLGARCIRQGLAQHLGAFAQHQQGGKRAIGDLPAQWPMVGLHALAVGLPIAKGFAVGKQAR